MWWKYCTSMNEAKWKTSFIMNLTTVWSSPVNLEAEQSNTIRFNKKRGFNYNDKPPSFLAKKMVRSYHDDTLLSPLIPSWRKNPSISNAKVIVVKLYKTLWKKYWIDFKSSTTKTTLYWNLYIFQYSKKRKSNTSSFESLSLL